MGKLRKMLGRADDPEIVTLMRQIETQSVQTLAKWAADCARTRYLPVYEAHTADDGLRTLPDTVYGCLAGTETRKTLQAALREGRKLAQQEADPTAQAAARAIVTACGVLTTPTNALGFCFYGAAAAAYHELGLADTAQAYDRRAQEELNRLSALLAQVMVTDEQDPVHMDWNC